jgi:hypothetical protein
MDIIVSVIADWVATYDDPMRIIKNDPIALSGREDIWVGHRWLWASAPSELEGWIPDTLVVKGLATYTYSAAELTCAIGEVLTMQKQTHGWSWCKNLNGISGWVPHRCLAPT